MQKKLPVAVVGMAGIFPGAPDIDIFWNNIINKVDSCSEVPEGRWITEPEFMYNPEPAPDKVYSKRACLIHDDILKSIKSDLNDINIDKDILNDLDPLFHLVLHTGKKALSNCNISTINKQRIGTVLAAIALPTDSSSFITRKIIGKSFEEKLFGNNYFSTSKPLTRAQCLASRVTSLPASILAKGLGLGGGSYTLDAACASSLYAVKLACDELHSLRADTMLAGGVSRPECLYTQVGFSQLRALSPSGRCAPFDEKADGLVVGEGAGILVLKRLDDALRDNDNIYGLIRGMGLSNDMSGNLLAPDIEGQVRAMRSAYLSAGWSPCEIDLIECHGAGTRVGDTTELHSLRNLWGESGWSYEQCSIGSVKSMIGHLLTGAGAAGMIKTFLALKHKVLPPSINFNKTPEKSPLKNSPFRVQTKAEEWIRKNNKRPLRAAVSAFGFGGINGHLLIEEWYPDSENNNPAKIHQIKNHCPKPVNHSPQPAVAIVGMDAAFGRLKSLKDFKETIFKGSSIIRKRPEDRWKGCDNIAAGHLDGKLLYGAFMDKLALTAGKFHMPPNEIPDILPQHLLMLKVSSNAMKDAGLADRKKRPKTGVIIGMEFDFEATNYHLRWNLYNLVQKWINTQKLNPDKKETEIWLESLRNSSGPALTNTRTIGALGGIIASRIAREFCFGGPSFAVSCEEASGLKALETGVRSLQQNETDAVLVGAIDLAGDVRNVITTNKLKPYSKNNGIHPFDRSADGTLPGEGAAALVLKRLDNAIKDGDRIYSVIKGLGCAAGDGIDTESPSKDAYTLSLKRSFQDADISPSSISYFETHGSGDPLEDKPESEALNDFFAGLSDNKKVSCAIGSVKANIGHTGAASGLASLVKTSLCLYHEIIPPLTNFIVPANDRWQNSVFHMPAFPQYWLRDRKDGPRRACTASLTSDGICMHVILEGFEYSQKNYIPEKVEIERQRPLGDREFGLFVIEGNNKTSLMEGLEKLSNHIKKLKDPKAPGSKIEATARSWYLKNKPAPEKKYAVSIVAADIVHLENLINDAKNAVSEGAFKKINGPSGINYSPDPLASSGKTAFVFPGLGNHYVGMGRDIGVQWPEILRKMDAKTQQLRTQLVPQCYVLQRTSWMQGWEKEAYKKIISDPLNMIFGQVVHGGVTANLIMNFGIKPSAVIGYSLGESAGLFAMGAWSDHREMLKRMRKTDLFTTELAGPYNSVRQAWNITPDKDIKWCVAVVNRPKNIVLNAINKFPYAKLLIINTPDECVIGGQKDDIEASIKMLGCKAIFLDGIVSVHCDAAAPVADAYKELHIFPTASPENMKFYSCALGCSYALTSNSAASSILKQAIKGFDFTALIDQAYKDGIRIFLEMGPHSSCSRMISRILDKKPHLAVSACVRGEDDYITILKFLGSLITERVPVDLDKIYGTGLYEKTIKESYHKKSEKQLTLTIGGKAPSPALPRRIKATHAQTQFENQEIQLEDLDKVFSYNDLIGPVTKNTTAVSEAHKTFINFSNDLTKGIEKTFAIQTRLLENIISGKEIKEAGQNTEPDSFSAFSRDMCMEFAIGSAAKVLGPEFAAVDTYKVRVRLPDEPLMLVDRIISVEGEKGSLGSGRIVTEHDVLPEAWYLDGGHAPVCISVESGQADLFLCSYLGIDHAVKGKRSYRLLDAVVKFYRGLPCPGDVIIYEIEIEKFVRQGDTYLFFFNFEGFINNKPLISMTDGCAGFFTEEEVKKSGGIILTKEDTEPVQGKKPSDWNELVPIYAESYNDEEVKALRSGNLEKCFGALFNGIKISDSLKLPGGRMKLIDRILNLDPKGGRYGMGMIRAEADIHPDDWFLTCHFKDDMVMPGTLMYECCAHTLRVFIQRMGWITDKPDVCYEPVIGVASILKCRGPVTPDTRHVVYEVEIKETGYGPEPFVIADAHMFGDGRRIVMFKDMSIKMSGITREEIESAWKKKAGFDYDRILAFSTGKPSEAFGEPYKVFDEERIIARLPGPPYLFIDKITDIEPEQWALKPDGWIQAEYKVQPDGWYFKANRIPAMPFCILLEIALQPCGWLAAYLGSALKSKTNLKFRNLGGTAVLHHQVLPDSKLLTMRTRMTQVAEAGDMIIEHFDIQILQSDKLIYEGNTNFGFFTKKALAQQVGIIDADERAYKPDAGELKRSVSHVFAVIPPLTPYDLETASASCMAMPSKALLLIDEIETYICDGGTEGLGFIRGVKKVDPDEWFFKAHFYQDPVCPGSLGIESFIQLIKFMAIDRWSHLAETHMFETITDKPHIWIYRGQIVPENKKIEIEAIVTKIQDIPIPTIQANGFLKVDGLYIYEMQDFGIRLVPKN
ncbi:MAG: type I polyketide synthase [Deltaproteobacteria bacterium]|nr:type I polyketide synthase [Deltaproteobacteria bacterium]